LQKKLSAIGWRLEAGLGAQFNKKSRLIKKKCGVVAITKRAGAKN